MIFTVLVHEAEEGGYWGQCVEVPGAISQGETLDEMDANIREAIELIIEIMIEDGDDIASFKDESLLADVEPGVRKWEIDVPLPQPSSV